MKLLKLVLENFQGILNFTLDAGGKDVNIIVNNGGGKTTIANAIFWLLYDKPYSNIKNFSPKTHDKAGKDVHFLHHSAFGTFKLDNGTIISFKRDLYENYSKIKGSVTEKFTGHNIEHFIDGVPVKEKEFRSRIDEICETERAKMLTSPFYFAEQISNKDRLAILLEICGDVSDTDVFESSKELSKLPGFLQKPGNSASLYTIEEYKAISSKQRLDINDELEKLPIRIDELKRQTFPELDETADTDVIDTMVARLEMDKAKYESEKLAFAANSDAEIRKQLSDAEAELAEARNRHNQQQNAVNESVNADIQTKQNKKYEIMDKISRDKRDMAGLEADKKHLENLRELMMAQYHSTFAEVFPEPTPFEYDSVCPTCGQAIPEEQIEEARQKYQSEVENKRELWSLDKSNRLEKINKRGLSECSKEMVADAAHKIATLSLEISTLTEQYETIDKEISELRTKLKEPVNFETTEEYAALSASAARIREIMNAEGNNTAEQKKAIQAKIDGVAKEIDGLKDKKYQIRHVKAEKETQAKKIADYTTRITELSQQYEKIEQGLFLCEEFVRAKSRMLDERINNKFESVRFRLFKDQINGGLCDDCTAMVPGDDSLVSFPEGNTAGRVNAGLEIIKVLSEHWGVTLPVIIDNAESVQRLKEITSQKICLYVPPKFETVVPFPDDGSELEKARWEQDKTAFEESNRHLRVV